MSRFLPKLPKMAPLVLSFDSRRPRRKRPEQRERSLQSVVSDFLDYALPEDAVPMSIPGGDRARTTTPGYRPGTPDGLIVWRSIAHFIELKDRISGRVSDNQTETHAAIRQAGGKVAVCYSLEDVIKALFDWGIPIKARLTAGGAWVRDVAP